jgi:hypothetical protein
VAVERIAHEVGFSSANALRNALQRYGGTTPSAVRAAGGLDALVARLCGHRASGRRRVAEGAQPAASVASAAAACALLPALRERERLIACLTAAVVAGRVGCRGGCAGGAAGRRIVAPRSSRRTSAVPGGRASGGTAQHRRET